MKTWMSVALVVGLAWAAAAQPSGPRILSQDEAVALAFNNNLGLKSEGIDLERKKRARDTAWNSFVPRMQAAFSFSRPNDPPPEFSALVPVGPMVGGVYERVATVTGKPEHRWDAGGSVSASLSFTLQMYYGIRRTVLDYEAGLIDLAAARARLERDVRKSFLNLLLQEENIKLMRRNLETARTRYEQDATRYRSGLVDEFTVLSAQVAWENMKPALAQLENGYTTSLLSFKNLIGLELDEAVRLEGSIEPELVSIDAERLLGSFLNNRLDVQGLKAAVALLENLKALRRSELYPNLTLSLSVDPRFQGDPFGDPWFDDLEERWSQRSGSFGISLSLALDPLLPNSKTRVAIADAEGETEKTRLALAQALRSAEVEIRSSVLELDRSARAIEILKLNVDLASKANRLGQEAYRAGLRDFSQIEDTELELQQAQFRLLREKFTYASGLLDLAYGLNASIDRIKEARK